MRLAVQHAYCHHLTNPCRVSNIVFCVAVSAIRSGAMYDRGEQHLRKVAEKVHQLRQNDEKIHTWVCPVCTTENVYVERWRI